MIIIMIIIWSDEVINLYKKDAGHIYTLSDLYVYQLSR